jgi:PAS domain S-box-containing protein
MNHDPADMLSLLDNSMFFPFDDTMAMSLNPAGDLPQSFTTGPAQPSSSTAVIGNAEPAAFSPEEPTSTIPGASNPPGESLGSGNPSNSSVLAEFTKRRNWPARVVEELQDLLHILDANGRIKHVSPSVEHLTGYKPSELRDLLMRDLLHPDDVGVFTSELNGAIASGTQLRVFYRMRKKDGQYAVFEAVGHAHIAAAKFAPNPNNQTPFCQAVFLMARPYPTKNAAMLDSFLEHKMENENLRRKIADLQREEQEEAEEFEREWLRKQQKQTQEAPFPTPTDASFPPRERRVSQDSSVSTDTAASTRRTSLSESATHAETIEMLTGLRYQQGERSRGITTGNANPVLITGDAGIAIPVDRDPRPGEKNKKKKKLVGDYVCTSCGEFTCSSSTVLYLFKFSLKD